MKKGCERGGLKKSKLCGDLLLAFLGLEGAYKVDGDSSPTPVMTDKGQRCKLKAVRLRSDWRKKVFTMKVVRH